jgi:hypothetical protein
MKSLKSFKPALATTLAIGVGWLLTVRPAEAGYTVTLQQVGPDVVATGSGAINLTGLIHAGYLTYGFGPGVLPGAADDGWGGVIAGRISTGPTIAGSVDSYHFGLSGPTSFGSGGGAAASSGSGDTVGTEADCSKDGSDCDRFLIVPRGYVSGTFLSNSATYSGKTFATLGVTPGTYIWKWGTGANQNFTLKILGEILPAANLTNVSTRASVQTGQSVAIAGFIVTGTDSKRVVVRGLGPTLTQFGVLGVLADPTLNLHDATHTIATNDNWKDAQQTAIEATGLAPQNDAESAIVLTLPPGNYTAILSGNNGTTGVGLVEVYDISGGGLSELTNVSTRGLVGTGENVVIAGFITGGGNGPTQVVVRGLGPTLVQFGVSGTLADPTVTLMDSNGNVVQSNDNWRDSQQPEIQNSSLQPPNDLEAAILATVPAGNYTAILSGNGGGTGIGLVEVYKLP